MGYEFAEDDDFYGEEELKVKNKTNGGNKENCFFLFFNLERRYILSFVFKAVSLLNQMF